MKDETRLRVLRIITQLTLMGGIALGLWLLTAIPAVLYASAFGGNNSGLFILITGIVFSAIKGAGVSRRRPSARLFLILSYTLALIYIIWYISYGVKEGFSSDRILFWFLLAGLAILTIIFLISSKTKELFKDK